MSSMESWVVAREAQVSPDSDTRTVEITDSADFIGLPSERRPELGHFSAWVETDVNESAVVTPSEENRVAVKGIYAAARASNGPRATASVRRVSTQVKRAGSKGEEPLEGNLEANPTEEELRKLDEEVQDLLYEEPPEVDVYEDGVKTIDTLQAAFEGANEGVYIISYDEDDSPQESSTGGNVTEDPIKDYLKQLYKTPLLNKGEVTELAERIEVGLAAEERLNSGQKLTDDQRRELSWLGEDGRRAKEHLWTANLRLVVSIAKRYTGLGMPFLDLIQEGNIGLETAIQRFDYKKDYAISTYATWWIRKEIVGSMTDQVRVIRIPKHTLELFRTIRKASQKILQETGEEPTPEQLAKELDTTSKKIVELKRHAQIPKSLHEPVSKDDTDVEFGTTIIEEGAVEVDQAFEKAELKERLHSLLNALSVQDAEIIFMRYLSAEPKTIKEISEIYDLTAEGARLRLRAAVSKLKKAARGSGLEEFLR